MNENNSLKSDTLIDLKTPAKTYHRLALDLAKKQWEAGNLPPQSQYRLDAEDDWKPFRALYPPARPKPQTAFPWLALGLLLGFFAVGSVVLVGYLGIQMFLHGESPPAPNNPAAIAPAPVNVPLMTRYEDAFEFMGPGLAFSVRGWEKVAYKGGWKIRFKIGVKNTHPNIIQNLEFLGARFSPSPRHLEATFADEFGNQANASSPGELFPRSMELAPGKDGTCFAETGLIVKHAKTIRGSITFAGQTHFVDVAVSTLPVEEE